MLKQLRTVGRFSAYYSLSHAAPAFGVKVGIEILEILVLVLVEEG